MQLLRLVRLCGVGVGILDLSLYDDTAFCDKGGDCAYCGQDGCEHGTYYTYSQGQLYELLAVFIFNDDTADITFVDKFFNFAEQGVATYFEFFFGGFLSHVDSIADAIGCLQKLTPGLCLW